MNHFPVGSIYKIPRRYLYQEKAENVKLFTFNKSFRTMSSHFYENVRKVLRCKCGTKEYTEYQDMQIKDLNSLSVILIEDILSIMLKNCTYF